MYWNSILWFLTWPLFIIVAWFLVRFIVTKYKHVLDKTEE